MSPDARNAALTITSAGSGVSSLDSGQFSLLTTLQPTFRGWAGSQGLLAQVNPPGPTGLSLSLDPIDGSQGQLIMEGFKCGLVEDPSGRWFAYDCGRAVTFHRADGSELNERPLGFNARTVAAIDKSGRVSAAVWP